MLWIEAKGDSTVLQELKQTLEAISLDKLIIDRTPITQKIAFRGPKGYGFQMTGCFFLYDDGSHPEYNSMPYPSNELYKVRYSDIYPRYLETAKGNEDEALSTLIEDVEHDSGQYHSLPSFIGRWLIIDEVSDSLFKPNERGYIDTELPISIEADPKVWYEAEPYIDHIEDLAPDSPVVTSFLYELSISEVFWRQEYVRAARDNCRIELVELPELKAEFFVPEKSTETRLWLPENLKDCYKNDKRYQPNIDTFISPRQRPIDKEMAKSFIKKGEYSVVSYRGTNLIYASRSPSRLIQPEASGSTLYNLPRARQDRLKTIF